MSSPTVTTPDIRFYHLTQRSVENTLPVLLEKTLERGQRAVLRFGSQERLEAMDHHLWIYNDHAFLPHGHAKTGHSADQPLWLTCADENPNHATYLFCLDRAEMGDPQGYDMVAMVFDARDPQAVSHARSEWKRLSQLDNAKLSYWQQTDQGGWAQKA